MGEGEDKWVGGAGRVTMNGCEELDGMGKAGGWGVGRVLAVLG